MTESPATLATALAELQQQLPEVVKSSTAEVEMKTGGKFRYTYAGLADVSRQVLPLLGKLGMSFSGRPTLNHEGKFVLAYELLHVSGESRTGEYPLSGSTPQAVGSSITYARRYTLLAVTGLAPDDDDDAAAAQAEADAQRGTAQRSGRQRPPTSGQGGATAQRARQPRLPGEPDGITPGQQAKLHILLKEANLTDRDEALAYMAGVVKRDVTSTKDLTKQEAMALINALDPQPDEETGP